MEIFFFPLNLIFSKLLSRFFSMYFFLPFFPLQISFFFPFFSKAPSSAFEQDPAKKTNMRLKKNLNWFFSLQSQILKIITFFFHTQTSLLLSLLSFGCFSGKKKEITYICLVFFFPCQGNLSCNCPKEKGHFYSQTVKKKQLEFSDNSQTASQQ